MTSMQVQGVSYFEGGVTVGWGPRESLRLSGEEEASIVYNKTDEMSVTRINFEVSRGSVNTMDFASASGKVITTGNLQVVFQSSMHVSRCPGAFSSNQQSVRQ